MLSLFVYTLFIFKRHPGAEEDEMDLQNYDAWKLATPPEYSACGGHDSGEWIRCDDCRAVLPLQSMQQMRIDGEPALRASGAPVWICDPCADARELEDACAREAA